MTVLDDRIIATAVERGKREIVSDAREGRIPIAVPSFSALHDHVDANEYGGLCDDGWDWDGDPDLVRANAVQGALDAWIRGGGLVEAFTPS
jgi:hypothetical protein